MIKKKFSFCIIFVMCLSSIGVTANAQTATSWTEDFSNGLSNWTSYGYSVIPGLQDDSNITSQENSGYNVQNGMLVSGFGSLSYAGLGNMSFIFRNSTFQEGNFTFDAFIANWTTTHQVFEVYPMISEPNSNFNFLGETTGVIFNNCITLQVQGAYGFSRIRLWNGYGVEGTYNVHGSQYNSFHHFVININLTNGINVFMDNKNIISSLTTPTFQSQKFGFNNKVGISMFDNISVEGTPATTTQTQSTPGYSFIIVIPAMITITLLIDRIKKKRNN